MSLLKCTSPLNTLTGIDYMTSTATVIVSETAKVPLAGARRISATGGSAGASMSVPIPTTEAITAPTRTYTKENWGITTIIQTASIPACFLV